MIPIFLHIIRLLPYCYARFLSFFFRFLFPLLQFIFPFGLLYFPFPLLHFLFLTVICKSYSLLACIRFSFLFAFGDLHLEMQCLRLQKQMLKMVTSNGNKCCKSKLSIGESPIVGPHFALCRPISSPIYPCYLGPCRPHEIPFGRASYPLILAPYALGSPHL